MLLDQPRVRWVVITAFRVDNRHPHQLCFGGARFVQPMNGLEPEGGPRVCDVAGQDWTLCPEG